MKPIMEPAKSVTRHSGGAALMGCYLWHFADGAGARCIPLPGITPCALHCMAQQGAGVGAGSGAVVPKLGMIQGHREQAAPTMLKL